MTHLPLRNALAPLTVPVRTPSSLLTGLMAYWKLDETSGTRADSSGNGNSIAVAGTPGSASGKIGNAATFAADGSRLVKAGTTFQFAAADFTISAWINPNSLVGGDQWGKGVMRSLSGDAIGDWMIGVQADGDVQCAHWKSAGADTTGSHQTSATGLVSTSTWTHVVFRRSSGTYTIWTNGTSRAFTNVSTASGWGNVGFEMGRIFGGATYGWNGLIDEAGVWNRGISDSEIAALYNGGTGVTYPFS